MLHTSCLGLKRLNPSRPSVYWTLPSASWPSEPGKSGSDVWTHSPQNSGDAAGRGVGLSAASASTAATTSGAFVLRSFAASASRSRALAAAIFTDGADSLVGVFFSVGAVGAVAENAPSTDAAVRDLTEIDLRATPSLNRHAGLCRVRTHGTTSSNASFGELGAIWEGLARAARGKRGWRSP